MILETDDNWQTPSRGDSVDEYQLYLALADDGAGNDQMRGKPRPMSYIELFSLCIMCT